MGFEIIRFILVLSFVHITIWTKKSEITLLTVWVSNLGPTFEYITQVMYGSRFPSTGPGSRVRIWVGPISVTHTVHARFSWNFVSFNWLGENSKVFQVFPGILSVSIDLERTLKFSRFFLELCWASFYWLRKSALFQVFSGIHNFSGNSIDKKVYIGVTPYRISNSNL